MVSCGKFLSWSFDQHTQTGPTCPEQHTPEENGHPSATPGVAQPDEHSALAHRFVGCQDRCLRGGEQVPPAAGEAEWRSNGDMEHGSAPHGSLWQFLDVYGPSDGTSSQPLKELLKGI